MNACTLSLRSVSVKSGSVQSVPFSFCVFQEIENLDIKKIDAPVMTQQRASR